MCKRGCGKASCQAPQQAAWRRRRSAHALPPGARRRVQGPPSSRACPSSSHMHVQSRHAPGTVHASRALKCHCLHVHGHHAPCTLACQQSTQLTSATRFLICFSRASTSAWVEPSPTIVMCSLDTDTCGGQGGGKGRREHDGSAAAWGPERAPRPAWLPGPTHAAHLGCQA